VIGGKLWSTGSYGDLMLVRNIMNMMEIRTIGSFPFSGIKKELGARAATYVK